MVTVWIIALILLSFDGCVCEKTIHIFTSVIVCLPSEEVTQKYLSLKIANIYPNSEIYLLRPNCCSNMITYDDAPDNLHIIEFNASYQYPEVRKMLTSYNLDLWISMHRQNCQRILLNDDIINKLKNIPFNFSIIQTWDLCGSIISDMLNLKRIDFQIESFMYPMLDEMYDFIYYNVDNIIPKSGSDETFKVQILIPYFNQIRKDFNVSIKTQQESWNKMTTFLWIPSIPGYEYPNYLLPRVQFIGPIRSDRNKYLVSNNKYSDVIDWLDGLPDDSGVIFFSFGTLWHDMDPLKYRDEQIFNALLEILIDADNKYDKYYIIFKSIHRDDIENGLIKEYGSNNRFKFYNYTQWIPQTRILNHSRVKLLICHAGYGHVQEAIYHSVPFITIPFQFDQPLNSEKASRIGISYLLNISTFTSDDLLDKIQYILNNETFYQKSKAWSNAMKLYDGTSIIKFTIQTILDGISDFFKLNIDSDKKLKHITNQNKEQCKS